jgi:hypothetical protein
MSKKRAVVAVLAVTAVAGAGVAAGVFLTRGTPEGPAASSTAPAATSSAPPLGDEAGFEDVSPTPTASIGPDPDAGQTVAVDEPVVATGSDVPVTVTFYGWNPTSQEVQVGGYVGGVVEEGGVCTLTLTKGGQTVTGRSEALPDASSTACGAVTVPGDEVAAGTWRAVLSYSSPAHSGTSDAVDVEVAP